MTFIESLYEADLIPRMMFSIYLSSTTKVTDTDSVIIFGSSALHTYSSLTQTHKVDITDTGFWSVNMPAVTVHSQVLNITAKVAIIDTGTSLLGVHETDYADLILSLVQGLEGCEQPAGGFFGCTCHNSSDFPTITLTLGGYDFDISPERYTQEAGSEGYHRCFLLIQPSSFRLKGGQSAWILGDVFMREYYMEFDMEERTIGIAGGRASSHSPGNSGFRAWVIIGAISLAAITVLLLFKCRKNNAPATNYAPLPP